MVERLLGRGFKLSREERVELCFEERELFKRGMGLNWPI